MAILHRKKIPKYPWTSLDQGSLEPQPKMQMLGRIQGGHIVAGLASIQA